MTPRFEVAGFAITLLLVFLLCSRFKPGFPDFDTSILGYDYGASKEDLSGDVEEPNPWEDALVADLFAKEERVLEDPGPGQLKDTMNSTLGFGKVFVISMPDRGDKRDAFTLQARMSNITFEVRDGVSGADVPAKALPLNFVQDPGATGCWRAHLNVMQEMVRDNIQSALVFEDDADWDVAVKYQALQAARATRFITEQPEEGQSLSPYGDGWDIIWFGHCAAQTDKENDRRFVVTEDPTVLPPWSRSEFVKPDMSLWEEDSDDYLNLQTRIYFRSSWNSCTAAYAISLRGAEKVVFTESMVPYNDPVDNGMGAMCNQHLLDFTCIAPYPTVVGISKPAGASNRGSDIRGLENDQIAEQGWSERVVFSTRQNIPRILTGGEDFVSGFAEDVIPPMKLEDIGRAVGHGEWVWGGNRYSEEGEYQAARDNVPETEGQEEAGEFGDQQGQPVAEAWESPLEPEVEQLVQEAEVEAAVVSEIQSGNPKEEESAARDAAVKLEPEMEGHTPEMLDAQPQ